MKPSAVIFIMKKIQFRRYPKFLLSHVLIAAVILAVAVISPYILQSSLYGSSVGA